MMSSPTLIRVMITRGLPWTQQFVLSADDVDFSTADITAQVRVSPGAALLATAAAAVDGSVVGTGECTVTLTSEITAVLPDTCTMDVIAGVPDDGIDPDVLLRVQITVTSSVTSV